MLRRMRHVTRTGTCTELTLSTTHAHNPHFRHLTTRGQFNPIHDFTYGITHHRRARNPAEFATMITNPGPLRVSYSADYLDWLYRAYRAKIRHTDNCAARERVFAGHLLSSSLPSNSSSGRKSSDSNSSAAKFEQTYGSTVLGVPPTGLFLRPANSLRRVSGQLLRMAAQRTLSDTARRQGLLDLFERQQQFPVIHLDRARRFHLAELFKETVLDKALTPSEVWDKALLYRAILSERRASYPDSFGYIMTAVDDTVFAAPTQDSTTQGNSDTHSSTNAMSSANEVLSEANVHHTLQDRCPRWADYCYFLYLVRRYYIDNAVEGHVVLRCHREPNAARLLFTNPPPRDEAEVRRSLPATPLDATTKPSSTATIRSASSTVSMAPLRPPASYPPIEALWRCEENVPLLTLLLFGELNLIVSENPFVKFTYARAFLTRPYASESDALSEGDPIISSSSSIGDTKSQHPHNSVPFASAHANRNAAVTAFSQTVAQRRGHLLPAIPRNVAAALDARASEVIRSQQRHQREDVIGFQRLLRAQGTPPIFFDTSDADSAQDSTSASSASASSAAARHAGGGGATTALGGTTVLVSYMCYADWAYLNPHAVRAETRDALSRSTMTALRQYERASEDLYRESYDELEVEQTHRPVEQHNGVATYMPTRVHFTALLRDDPHISFLLHVALKDESECVACGHHNDKDAVGTDGEEESEMTRLMLSRQALERLIRQLGGALYATALEYGNEQARRVNRQKVNIAAVLLDQAVEQALHQISLLSKQQAHAQQQQQQQQTAPTNERDLSVRRFWNGMDDAARMVERLGAYVPFEGRALDENGFTTDARMDDYRRWMEPAIST